MLDELLDDHARQSDRMGVITKPDQEADRLKEQFRTMKAGFDYWCSQTDRRDFHTSSRVDAMNEFLTNAKDDVELTEPDEA